MNYLVGVWTRDGVMWCDDKGKVRKIGKFIRFVALPKRAGYRKGRGATSPAAMQSVWTATNSAVMEALKIDEEEVLAVERRLRKENWLG